MLFFFLVKPRPLDVGVLIDSSTTVGRTQWEQLKSFVKSVSNSFAPSWPGNHIGLITYGRDAEVAFLFNSLRNEQLNPSAVNRLIDTIPYRDRGERRLVEALQLANSQLFSSRGGARPKARQVFMQG